MILKNSSPKICIQKNILILGIVCFAGVVAYVAFAQATLQSNKALSSKAAPRTSAAFRPAGGGEGSECGADNACNSDVDGLKCFYHLEYFTNKDARKRICHTIDKVWGSEGAPCINDGITKRCNGGLSCVKLNTDAAYNYLISKKVSAGVYEFQEKFHPWSLDNDRLDADMCIPQNAVSTVSSCGGLYEPCCGTNMNNVGACDDHNAFCGNSIVYGAPAGATKPSSEPYCLKLSKELFEANNIPWQISFVNTSLHPDKQGAMENTSYRDETVFEVETNSENASLEQALNSPNIGLRHLLVTGLDVYLGHPQLYTNPGFITGSVTFDCGTGKKVTFASSMFETAYPVVLPGLVTHMYGSSNVVTQLTDDNVPVVKAFPSGQISNKTSTQAQPSANYCGWVWDKEYEVGPVSFTIKAGNEAPITVEKPFEKAKIKFKKVVVRQPTKTLSPTPKK